MTDTSLLLDEHRVPDGSRPLVVGRPRPALAAMVLESWARPVACFTVGWAAKHGLEVPSTCRRVIAPGEHYLRHTETSATGRVIDERDTVYCAPCAVRDAHWWDVREVAA